MESQREKHPPICWSSPTTLGLLGIHGIGIASFGLWLIGVLHVPTYVWWLAAANYAFRGVLVAGVYHRYFSHQSYEFAGWMRKGAQLTSAFLAQMSGEGGVLWWLLTHVDHHRWTDKSGDPHSPKLGGFWWAHMGWLLREPYQPKTAITELQFKEFNYPSLIWIDKFHFISLLTNALICFWIGEWVGLLIGFFFSTTVLQHGTWCINSVAHVVGTRPHKMKNTSRNFGVLDWLLATFGEGKHNNHHRYPKQVRQGFWDPTYFVYVWPLKVLHLIRLPQPIGLAA